MSRQSPYLSYNHTMTGASCHPRDKFPREPATHPLKAATWIALVGIPLPASPSGEPPADVSSEPGRGADGLSRAGPVRTSNGSS